MASAFARGEEEYKPNHDVNFFYRPYAPSGNDQPRDVSDCLEVAILRWASGVCDHDGVSPEPITFNCYPDMGVFSGQCVMFSGTRRLVYSLSFSTRDALTVYVEAWADSERYAACSHLEYVSTHALIVNVVRFLVERCRYSSGGTMNILDNVEEDYGRCVFMTKHWSPKRGEIQSFFQSYWTMNYSSHMRFFFLFALIETLRLGQPLPEFKDDDDEEPEERELGHLKLYVLRQHSDLYINHCSYDWFVRGMITNIFARLTDK